MTSMIYHFPPTLLALSLHLSFVCISGLEGCPFRLPPSSTTLLPRLLNPPAFLRLTNWYPLSSSLSTAQRTFSAPTAGHTLLSPRRVQYSRPSLDGVSKSLKKSFKDRFGTRVTDAAGMCSSIRNLLMEDGSRCRESSCCNLCLTSSVTNRNRPPVILVRPLRV